MKGPVKYTLFSLHFFFTDGIIFQIFTDVVSEFSGTVSSSRGDGIVSGYKVFFSTNPAAEREKCPFRLL